MREIGASHEQGERVNKLSVDEARERVREILDSDYPFRAVMAGSSVMTKDLGPITQEFFSRYSAVESENGAIVLRAGDVDRSDYDSRFIRLGRFDYIDVAVAPGSDAIVDLDGSESGFDVESVSPTIYHWLVQVSQDLS